LLGIIETGPNCLRSGSLQVLLEPLLGGGAVLAAVRDGTLPEDRLQSYLKLQGELRYLESLQDESARADRKRKEKELSRAAYRWLVDKRIVRR
jgi:hypothetical protein